MAKAPSSLVDYYAILGVGKKATDEEISKAVKALRRTWIGRQNSPDPRRRSQAEEMIRSCDDAEKILLNPTARQRYDQDLAAQLDKESQEGESSKPSKGTSAEGWIERAQEYLRLGNAANAFRAASEAVARDGGNPQAWETRSRANLAMGKIADADFDLTEACSLAPRDIDLLISLAQIREVQKNYSSAQSLLKDAYQIAPDSIDVHLATADCFAKQGKFDEGIKFLEPLASSNPNNKGYTFFLVSLLIDQVEEQVATSLGNNKYTYTSAEQLDRAKTILERARTLAGSDTELVTAVNAAEAYRAQQQAVRFVRPAHWWPWVVGFFIGFSVIGRSPIVGIIILGALGFGFYKSHWIPAWKANSKIPGLKR